MKGNQKDVEIDRNITYSPITETFNKPLKIVNHSDQTYVFKVCLIAFRSKPTNAL